MLRTIFKPPFVANIVFVVLGVSSFAVGYYLQNDAEAWLSYFFFAFGVVGLAALFESLTSYIRLEDDALCLRSRFTTSRVLRSKIRKVTWEKGSGVTLEFLDGSWVRLPEMFQNSQGLCNSIRAWLRSQED